MGSVESARSTPPAAPGSASRSAVDAAAGPLSEEDRSKDDFFVRLAELAEAMIARHGKDFAMGTLVLSARFIAEGKPLLRQSNRPGE